MKYEWTQVEEPIYVYPDGTWKFPEDHLSWMGDDYEVKTIGYTCEEHDGWFMYECPECLMEDLKSKAGWRNYIQQVNYIPTPGQTFNIPDQLVLACGGTIWAVRDQQYKFKVGKI